jgi:hypothetical protein
MNLFQFLGGESSTHVIKSALIGLKILPCGGAG